MSHDITNNLCAVCRDDFPTNKTCYSCVAGMANEQISLIQAEVERHKQQATYWNEQCLEAWKWRDANAAEVERLTAENMALRVDAPKTYKLWQEAATLKRENAQLLEAAERALTAGERLKRENATLRKFASDIIENHHGSLDGADIEDIAVKHRLLELRKITESCSEECACAEFGFPADCYRKAGALDAAISVDDYSPAQNTTAADDAASS